MIRVTHIQDMAYNPIYNRPIPKRFSKTVYISSGNNIWTVWRLGIDGKIRPAKKLKK